MLRDPDRVEAQFFGYLRALQDVLIDLDIGTGNGVGVGLVLVGVLLVELGPLADEERSELHVG